MKDKNEVMIYYSHLSKNYEQIRLGNPKSKMISAFQSNWLINNLESDVSLCLEVGCGTGRITHDVIKTVKILIATDLSLEMIRINKNKTKTKQLSGRIEYVVCDASHLPFRDDCFDSVIGARIFWHIPDYWRALSEALRTVKANKPVLFDFPCLWGPFSLSSKLRRLNHHVLTEFINRATIKRLFRKAQNVTIEGNTSLALMFMPDKVLEYKTIRKLIGWFENVDYNFFEDVIYSYYLVKVTK